MATLFMSFLELVRGGTIIREHQVAIGVPYMQTSVDNGAVYIFNIESGQQLAKITGTDSQYERFGMDVAILDKEDSGSGGNVTYLGPQY